MTTDADDREMTDSLETVLKENLLPDSLQREVTDSLRTLSDSLGIATDSLTHTPAGLEVPEIAPETPEKNGERGGEETPEGDTSKGSATIERKITPVGDKRNPDTAPNAKSNSRKGKEVES